MSAAKPKTEVTIRGGGVAAHCCAHLLVRANVHVVLDEVLRPAIPAIMIGDVTRHLIEDVFTRTDLFGGLPRIRKRIVAWGNTTSEIAHLPHSAVVISEEELAARLRPACPALARHADSHWTVFATRPLPPPVIEHSFGTRTATAVEAILKDQSDPSACWIESLENGWLFLVPTGYGAGWLLSVGSGQPVDLLTSSRLIAQQIDRLRDDYPAPREFPAYPRIAQPLCDPSWFACGTAAMAFDPLCGDGVGNAIREAILAAAAIRAAATDPGNLDGVLSHYRMRLLAAFERHLEHCRPFYATGHSGDWWRAELDQILAGISWCKAERIGQPPYRFRLRDYDLEELMI